MNLRIATYNVHRCRGIDGRVRPQRIVDVLREIDADVIALQEVLSAKGGRPEHDQAPFIAERLGLHFVLGENRRIGHGAYGNVVLSRFAMETVCNHDLTVRGHERRGCLHTDVDMDGMLLHVFNVHLGTDFLERRHQGRRLIDPEILLNEGLKGSRVVLGDFNEWARGLTSKLLAHHFKSVDIRTHLRRSRTYPGLFPLLHLDHIYYDGALELERLRLHRTRKALIASDHLPLIAEFCVNPAKVGSLHRAESRDSTPARIPTGLGRGRGVSRLLAAAREGLLTRFRNEEAREGLRRGAVGGLRGDRRLDDQRGDVRRET